MALLQLKDITLSYGPRVLLEDVNLVVEQGDCIGLLGRNGEGKSSLLKLLAGEYQADDGEFIFSDNVSIGYLPQELPEPSEQSVYEFILSGHPEVVKALMQYNQASLEGDLAELEKTQALIEAKDGWSLDQKARTCLVELKLEADTALSSLSGGWLRRVALARALVSEPTILLLDEPTNHLDIEAIDWLENLIERFRGAVFLITHDRRFLQAACNKILELDRGNIIEWRGDYQGFLKFREERLHAEEKQNALFDKRLAEEEVWIRQGIKARRTRNEGRVRALKAMREEYKARRVQQGRAKAEIEQAAQSGKIVAEANDLGFSWPNHAVFSGLNTIISRGDRIAIVGPNGVGKTSLLQVLLGEEQPQEGKLKLGVNREIAYFDQKRLHLNPEKTVMDNVSEGRDFIEINGKKRHIISYLQDFLFSPEKTRQPAKSLSGGEQNRLMLAKIFSKPANILVFDEPTNDLDLETLELLEELLMDFKGTILLVSHDREFVDNVVTRCFVMAGDGKVEEWIGGYSDCEANLRERMKALQSLRVAKENTGGNRTPATVGSVKETRAIKKLSYKLQRELDNLPDEVETLEQDIAELIKQSSSADFYQQEVDVYQAVLNELSNKQQLLEDKMERWLELEALQEES